VLCCVGYENGGRKEGREKEELKNEEERKGRGKEESKELIRRSLTDILVPGSRY